MPSRLFSSFVEANKFAKSMSIKSRRSAKVSRHAAEWLVEFIAGDESSESAALQETGASVPHQEAAHPIVENNAQIAESVLPTTTTSIEEAAESIMSELKAIKVDLDAEEKAKQDVELERIKAERKLRARVQLNLHVKTQQNYSGEPRKIYRAIEWETEAPARASQAVEHKQRVSELSHKGRANTITLCRICGYSLVPTSSSSHYCKCQHHTNYSINEGIAGTREENKKMRGQLWGDMRSRGRGK
jgi:rubrerythrin